jgi:hypothetical protein
MSDRFIAVMQFGTDRNELFSFQSFCLSLGLWVCYIFLLMYALSPSFSVGQIAVWITVGVQAQPVESDAPSSPAMGLLEWLEDPTTCPLLNTITITGLTGNARDVVIS